MNRDEWAHEFFTKLGVPNVHREASARAIVAQMQTEGGDSRWNPLNCVMRKAGSTPVPGNTAGVQHYPDYETGMTASIDTIIQDCCGFPLIVERYKNPASSSFHICRAIRKSQWGTGFLIYLVLADIRIRGYYDTYAGHKIAGSSP